MKLFGVRRYETHKIIYFFGFKIKIRRANQIAQFTESDVLKILNKVVDIKNCPKARGKLRKLQIADTLLLKIYHNICKKHKIEYFLHWGTLLGAVRHKGFIPWDNDLDTLIVYKDYEKLVDILQEEFKETNITLYGIDRTRGNDTLRITYKNFEKLNLDIFYMHPSKIEAKDIDKIKTVWNEYRKKYYEIYENKIKEKTDTIYTAGTKRYNDIYENPVIKKENSEILKDFRIKLNTEFEKKIKGCSFDEAKVFVNKLSSLFCMIRKEDLYPLQLAEFEGYEFYVPNNYERFLTDIYGNYLEFPKNFGHYDEFFMDFEEEQIDPIIEELRRLLKYRFDY